MQWVKSKLWHLWISGKITENARESFVEGGVRANDSPESALEARCWP